MAEEELEVVVRRVELAQPQALAQLVAVELLALVDVADAEVAREPLDPRRAALLERVAQAGDQLRVLLLGRRRTDAAYTAAGP